MNELAFSNDNKDVSEFVDKFLKKNKNFPLRNLYIFKSEDENGNITDVKYGVNLVVRTGFDYIVPPEYIYRVLYVGDGTGVPSYENTSLFNHIATASLTSEDSKSFPIYYDSERNLICQYRRCGMYTLDYTILNRTFDITEFGLMYARNPYKLITHGLILDSEGNPSHITKKLYEKMTIDFRILFVVTPEVQHRLIDLGIYSILQPFQFRTLNASGGWSSNITSISSFWVCDGNYAPIDSVSGYGGKDHSKSFQMLNTLSVNAKLKNSAWIQSPSLLNERWYEYVSCLRVAIANESNSSGYCNIFLPILIYGENETLVSDKIFSPRTTQELSLSEMFQGVRIGGWSETYGYGRFPVTNFKIESSYMYNFEDHDWTIPDRFTTCENSDFNRVNWIYRTKQVYMTNPNGMDKEMYICANDNVNIPIKAFSNTGIVLYASDEWWDPSTWNLITNLNELTLEQGTKRYYICESDTTFYPIRDQEYPEFICDGKEYTWDTTTYDNSSSTPHVCCSDEYECYCTPNYIFFHPEGLPGGYDKVTACVIRDLRFTFPASIVGPNVTAKYVSPVRHIFGDKLVICSHQWYSGSGWGSTNTSRTNIRILDISDSSINMNPNADLPFVDLQLDFTNKTQGQTSSSDIQHRYDGDYWLSYEPKAKELVAVKIHGGENEDTPEQHLIDSDIISYSFDHGMNHIIYSKDGFEYYYYNLETKAIEDTFNVKDFDSSVTTIDGYVGYNGIIYITAKYSSGDWFTYFYTISNRQWQVDKTIFTRSFFANTNTFNCCGYNENCAIFSTDNAYFSDQYDIIIIDSRNPYGFIKSISENLKRIRPYSCQLKYVNKQLLLSAGSTSNNGQSSGEYTYYNLLDIGWILDNGSFPPIYRQYLGSNHWAHYQSCMYKDDVIYRGEFSDSDAYYINILPIAKFVFHKMTITTNSITGYNNPFSIPETPFMSLLTSLSFDRLSPDPVSTDNHAYCIIYRIDMYEGSTLSHRFVPCTRNADSVNGLYDTVTNEFLPPLDPLSITANTSTAITTDYNLPSGYTQVYSISYITGEANWFTTANMSTPIIHTANTKIEWFGKIPTPLTSTTYTCLFGSQRYDNDNQYRFLFWSNYTNNKFGYRRGSSEVTVEAEGTYDTDIKIVCDGLSATWYAMSDVSTPIESITMPFGTTLDDGVTPFTFMSRGIPNGYDYTQTP
jgi:hypothetical protein